MGCVAESVYNKDSNKRLGEFEVMYATERLKSELEYEFEEFLNRKGLRLNIGFLTYKRLKKFKLEVEGEDLSGIKSDRTFKPDGKMLYLVENLSGIAYPIMASESKTQGTNQGRLKRGKPKQATGNACERGSKNVKIIERLFEHYPYTPFFMICSGYDFRRNHDYIYNKLAEMNGLNEVNKLYLNTGKTTKPYTIFAREKPWTINEIYPDFYKLGRHSLVYTLEKYFGYIE